MEGTMMNDMELQRRPEPKQGLKRMLAYKRKTTDTKKFIEEYIQNDRMNEEQKVFRVAGFQWAATLPLDFAPFANAAALFANG